MPALEGAGLPVKGATIKIILKGPDGSSRPLTICRERGRKDSSIKLVEWCVSAVRLLNILKRQSPGWWPDQICVFDFRAHTHSLSLSHTHRVPKPTRKPEQTLGVDQSQSHISLACAAATGPAASISDTNILCADIILNDRQEAGKQRFKPPSKR